MSADASEIPVIGDGGSEPEPAEAAHLLVLGDEEFVCADKFPSTLIIRYADDGALFLNKVLTRLVAPEDHDRMWDAYEAIEEDTERNEAIGDLLATYADRPTERPAPSARGSQRGKRK